MYIQEQFDQNRVLRAADRVVAERDEFVAYLRSQIAAQEPGSATLPLFTVFGDWLAEKSDQLYSSPFVKEQDRQTAWQWYLEFLPAIYLSAIDVIWGVPALYSQFTGILPQPPDGGDASEVSCIGYLLQGASESWPVTGVMRVELLPETQ
ncbi:hypothetical protein [Gordonia sp. N1V]|uniref:hypothetical protein n=1 Tax=Gordonia sp. N1V TaxID=3034163 RepID=UPI0023E2C05E|nr:hypothetical protein [Gordonia sp. N1V]MDF3284963.1 hypothetical protein [Gordonia sp. N1V]